MWIAFAFGSALFAGVTSVLAKCGIRQTDSHVATAIRTVVVVIMGWVMVAVTGAWGSLVLLRGRTLVFLVLSGIATGASWLCYFRALQLGSVNRVVPIDKFSIVLTIFLAMAVFHEPLTAPKAVGVAAIALGTYLMIRREPGAADGQAEGRAMVYAFASAVFASLTSILGKLGVTGVDSHAATAVRNCVVLVMAWLVVAVTGKGKLVGQVPRRELAFIALSGLATGASWLCYYRALQTGPASAVVPIDKLSILVTVAFSTLILKEPLSRRGAVGLGFITAGTLAMLL